MKPVTDRLDFVSEVDSNLADEYLENGYVVRDLESRSAFRSIQEKIVGFAASFLSHEINGPSSMFLNQIHRGLDAARLNEFRLRILEQLHQDPTINPLYFALAKNVLYSIVGNELAMQKRVNLSIQLPGDESSLLPIHADTWSGDSPYEVVLWVPLVDCFKTKSMFILPPDKVHIVDQFFSTGKENMSSEDLFEEVKSDLVWLSVKEGQYVLFNQCLPHGNRVNQEPESRWSINCRFKSVFSPYCDKRLGEFFEPITLKPASRLGLNYEFPGGQD